MTYSNKHQKPKERTKNEKNMYGWREHFNFCLNANKTVIKKLLSNETLKINVCTAADCGKSLLGSGLFLMGFPLLFSAFLFYFPPTNFCLSGNCSRINRRNAAFCGVGHLQFKLLAIHTSTRHPAPTTAHHIVAHLLFAAYQVERTSFRYFSLATRHGKKILCYLKCLCLSRPAMKAKRLD